MQGLSEKIVFSNREGIELAGRLEKPVGQPIAYAVFAHCFTCSKDIAAASRISRALARKGFAVLRFDFTGLGNSDGDFSNSNFSSNVDDLVAAAEFLASKYDAPRLLIGHSLGGAAVLMAASRLSSVKAVVTIGAPADAAHVIKNFKANIGEIESHGYAHVNLAGRKFTIKRQFVDDLKSQDHSGSIGTLDAALLVFHSPQDSIVGIDNAREIYQHARHPKSFISLDGADHLLSNKADSEYVSETIAAWAKRYLDVVEQGESSIQSEDQNWQVIVQNTDHSLKQKVTAGTHTLASDEPLNVGGQNLGPTPYDLLLAALGACTSMTLRLYSQRKKWELDKVEVYLNHKRVHAEDCAECENANGKVELIERVISISGNLDDDQKKRLMEIADKCPVHKTLEGHVSIVTTEIQPQ